MAHSKVLQRIKDLNPDYIDDYYFEEGNGHWMHTKSGYIVPSMECGTIREDTVNDMLAVISEGLQVGIYEDGHTHVDPNGAFIKLRVN